MSVALSDLDTPGLPHLPDDTRCHRSHLMNACYTAFGNISRVLATGLNFQFQNGKEIIPGSHNGSPVSHTAMWGSRVRKMAGIEDNKNVCM